LHSGSTSCPTISEQPEPVFHPGAVLRRDFDRRHSRAYPLDIAFRGRKIELDGFRQIHLGQYRDICAVENRRIFQRFIFTFGH
jgi:hypothetical protein